MSEIDVIMSDVEENQVRWFNQPKRVKRGVLNIMGSISKALFGTLDDEDAKEYLARFEEFGQQNKIRDQISKKRITPFGIGNQHDTENSF